MTTQTVYRLTLASGIDGLHSVKEPIPSPGPYEVLIRIHAVALNYRDIAIATGQYPLPAINNVVPTSDMAGEVLELGDKVSSLAVGDKVIPPVSSTYLYGKFKEGDDAFGSQHDGMLRQYVVLPENILVKLPESNLGWDQWASVLGTGSTVWSAFYGKTILKPGDFVLIQGKVVLIFDNILLRGTGTGGVSITALVFAKAAGAKTIITSSSDEKLQRAKLLGADHLINYKTHPYWATEVLRITDGVGVDHVIENGGIGTIEQSLECVAAGGHISLIGFLSDNNGVQPSILMPALIKAVTVQGIRAGSKNQLEEAVRFIGRDELNMPVDKSFGFSRKEVVAAFRYVADGKHFGKVCIKVD